jgi:hypothetical protein
MQHTLRNVIESSVYDPPQESLGNNMDWNKWSVRILYMWIALFTGINLIFLETVVTQILGVAVLLLANAWYLHHLRRLAQDKEDQ